MTRREQRLQAEQGSRPAGRAGMILIAAAGLLLGLLIYIFLILSHLAFTDIDIVDRAEFTGATPDSMTLPDDSTAVLPWSNAIRAPTQVYPEFPVIRVPQRDVLIENILIFGIDAHRPKAEVSLADSLILLTIDRRSDCIKLTLISGDLQVDVYGRSEPDRLKAAYAYGGAGLLINTLNETMNLDVQHFIMFDFWSAASLVDIMGGAGCPVDEDELDTVNLLINEQFISSRKAGSGIDQEKAILLENPGLQRLSGQQAIAWARVRQVNSDPVRTSRQQDIMISLLHRGSQSCLANMMILIHNGNTCFETNMLPADMVRIGLGAVSVADRVYQYEVPEEVLYSSQSDPWLLVADWKAQTKALGSFIWKKPAGSPMTHEQLSDSLETTSQTEYIQNEDMTAETVQAKN